MRRTRRTPCFDHGINVFFFDDFRDEMHHDCQVFRKYDVDQDNHLDKALFLFLWLIWCNQRDACGPNMSTEGKQDETRVWHSKQVEFGLSPARAFTN